MSHRSFSGKYANFHVSGMCM